MATWGAWAWGMHCGAAHHRPRPAWLAQLTHVSPKKTVEGAVGGLLSSIGVALGLYRVGGGCLGRRLWASAKGGPALAAGHRVPFQVRQLVPPQRGLHRPLRLARLRPPRPSCPPRQQAFGWPDNSLNAAALGTIVFFASLFGDLIESVIKRDAGLKVRRAAGVGVRVGA